MKRSLSLLIVIAISLTACTAAPQTAGQPESTPVPSPVPTQAVPAPTTVSMTNESPTSTPTTAMGAVYFQIVSEESSVTYEVGETFFNQNNRFNLAVGVTKTLSGTIFADLNNPSASSIGPVQVDISQFTSDSNRRDNAIRGNWLESSRFPIATFESTQIEGFPASYVEGQDYSLKVTGNLTVRETTRQITFDVITRLEGTTLSGSAETTILLSDFNVGPISIAGVLQTEDQARIILQFVARP